MHYQFEDRALYPALREIWQYSEPQPVEPRVFDLIHYLVRNRDRIVSKEELVLIIWEGRAISDTTLTSAVKAARRVLGDNGKTQSQIRTLHGTGFRFVGAVEEVPVERPALAAPVASAVAGPSVGVLPFAHLGEDQSLGLARGVTQDITVGLARTRWLAVSATRNSPWLEDAGLDALEAGRRLGVGYLLRGSVTQVGQRFHLSVMLSDVTARTEVWGNTFDRAGDDLIGLQHDVAGVVSAAVEAEIDQRERRRAIRVPVRKMDARSAYHRASDLLYRFAPESFAEIEDLLDRAAQSDPDFARIPAAQSFLYWQRAFFHAGADREGDIARAMDFAWQSVEGDSQDPQGHWALGRAAILAEDREGAIEALNRAVACNPNFANGHYSLALAKLVAGDHAGGMAHVERALALSPNDPMCFAFVALRAMQQSFDGAHDAAVEAARRAARQRHAHLYVQGMAAWIHQRAGQEEAARVYASALRRDHPWFTRETFFSSFPVQGAHREMVDKALAAVGF
ncbi:MAG: winged helix-turn-helix domain-containing protein [Pseudomonadota bacterium]